MASLETKINGKYLLDSGTTGNLQRITVLKDMKPQFVLLTEYLENGRRYHAVFQFVNVTSRGDFAFFNSHKYGGEWLLLNFDQNSYFNVVLGSGVPIVSVLSGTFTFTQGKFELAKYIIDPWVKERQESSFFALSFDEGLYNARKQKHEYDKFMNQ